MIGDLVVVEGLEYEIAKDNWKILRRTVDPNITKVMIPADVCEIGTKCFYSCKSLCEVTFETGSKLKEIGNKAFYRTNLAKIEIPSKCEVLTGGSLMGVKSVTISRENPFFAIGPLCYMYILSKLIYRYSIYR
jgi:hypothetical protein